jgi:hypothetical protein
MMIFFFFGKVFESSQLGICSFYVVEKDGITGGISNIGVSGISRSREKSKNEKLCFWVAARRFFITVQTTTYNHATVSMERNDDERT